MFKHNNWIVFPNTEPKEDILHCSNTVSGVCENTSLEQCIDICDNSPNCNSGYHVDGRCLAIDKTNFPFYFNPALYWKESSANVTAFIDNDEIPYPPIFSDSVFFTDTVFLKNVEKKLVLNTPFATVSKSDETITPINFTEKYGSVLTVSYSNPFNPGGDSKYKPYI